MNAANFAMSVAPASYLQSHQSGTTVRKCLAYNPSLYIFIYRIIVFCMIYPLQSIAQDTKDATLIYRNEDGLEYYAPGFFKGSPILGYSNEQLSDSRVTVAIGNIQRDGEKMLVLFFITKKEKNDPEIYLDDIIYTVYGKHALPLSQSKLDKGEQERFVVSNVAVGSLVSANANAQQLAIIVVYKDNRGSLFVFHGLHEFEK